ncbi:hypothetical protein BC831DRAFT_462461 [Entophlyctis helioformis]|nr:hypothetical protein BC831DRAFT_462461 [Entophlyctis helioformis]
MVHGQVSTRLQALRVSLPPGSSSQQRLAERSSNLRRWLDPLGAAGWRLASGVWRLASGVSRLAAGSLLDRCECVRERPEQPEQRPGRGPGRRHDEGV